MKRETIFRHPESTENIDRGLLDCVVGDRPGTGEFPHFTGIHLLGGLPVFVSVGDCLDSLESTSGPKTPLDRLRCCDSCVYGVVDRDRLYSG